MTHTPITSQVHQALDIHCSLTPKITFDDELRDFFSYPLNIILAEISNLDRRTQTGILAN
ncbi:uncharacterized protein sS8_2695 [Methylocaldum marinum]|uniref:Uncharacterized protein n=1 Tax=Methylocaldum marinum TaxID=1432792 RepID=A0A250KSU7_9GAMM|nr:uncharacterized protein sS8_2695 [Methylocaldum marinum]